MTDKQIIIDGIDVSGCEFFLKEHPQNCQKNYGGACSYIPNCYYKQLKRTEQKLEKIKKVCDKFIPDHYKILLIINGGAIEEQT